MVCVRLSGRHLVSESRVPRPSPTSSPAATTVPAAVRVRAWFPGSTCRCCRGSPPLWARLAARSTGPSGPPRGGTVISLATAGDPQPRAARAVSLTSLPLVFQLQHELEKGERDTAELQEFANAVLQQIADHCPDILEQVVNALEESC